MVKVDDRQEISLASDSYQRKSVIAVAGEKLKPGWAFKKLVLGYADRKFFTLAMVHLIITLVIFTHFALEKFDFQDNKVPEGASRRNWKVFVPTFEFGTMHAILFQLGMLPLTMCRLVISKASATALDTLIPFNETLKCHIAIGYTLVVLLFFTIVVFVMFFGVNCADGNTTFCEKFTSEIMITGYCIFALFLTVAITSYFRKVIRYRVFYVIHHLVFITYALTIAHTIDVVQRTKGGRSQTFKWFSASILLYITDRAAMYLLNRYQSKIKDSSTVVSSSDGKRMVILEVEKPDIFYFSPGQYVYLKIPSIDEIWHPFSVASSPSSESVRFYIEVFDREKGKSWTGNLYDKIMANVMDKESSNDKGKHDLDGSPSFDNFIEIMGPYGTSLGETENYSHALVIGAGTGIVPILSLLQLHVDQVMNLDRDRIVIERESHHKMVTSLQQAKKLRGGSILDMLRGKENSNKPTTQTDLKRGAYWIIFYNLLMFLTTCFGVIVFGLTVSWTLLPFEIYDGMEKVLSIGTLIFQGTFVILTITVQRRASMWTYLDIVFIILNGLADWFFYHRKLWGRFRSDDLFIYTILSLYMIYRSWVTLLRYASNPIESSHKRRSGYETMDKLHLVWTTRSPTLISQMYPDFENIWIDLMNRFEDEAFVRQICEISIYCTSQDKKACEDLEYEVQHTELFKSGALKFHRPSFPKILEDHTLSRIVETSLPVSRTLIAFCGSPSLANRVKEAKIMNDLYMFTAGRTNHKMDLVIESYGGSKPKKEKTIIVREVDDAKEDRKQEKFWEDGKVTETKDEEIPGALLRGGVNQSMRFSLMSNQGTNSSTRFSLHPGSSLHQMSRSVAFESNTTSIIEEEGKDDEEKEEETRRVKFQ